MKIEIIDGACNRSIPVDTEVYLLFHHCFFICGTNINWVIWQNNSSVCLLSKWCDSPMGPTIRLKTRKYMMDGGLL